MKYQLPKKSRILWKKQYRIVATQYPYIDLFERLDLSGRQKLALWKLQSRINPRLKNETGELQLVREEDMVSGPNASIVMAAFTHIGFPSRFTDGKFGVYYASRQLETAIRETAIHRERDAIERQLKPQEFDMRAYIGKINKPLYDIRVPKYRSLQTSSSNYGQTQSFAIDLLDKDPGAWGIAYFSAQHEGGDNIAIFRPTAVSLPINGPLLTYVWNGERIHSVYEKCGPILELD